MAHQPKIGLTLLAVTSIHSATNAFVALENHAKTAVQTFDRRRSVASRRGYSNNNNIDNNTNNDQFVSPGSIDPTSSASSDPIEFLFNDESFLDDVQPSPTGFTSESPPLDEDLNVDASAILAENAAILSSGSGDTIDLGFDLNLDATINSGTEVSEGSLTDLKAVLAASGEAAAAAEASMSQELVDHLDELAVEALNATNLVTASNDEVDVPPPEAVPTIATITTQQEQQSPSTSILSNVDELPFSPAKMEADISESLSTGNDQITAIETPSVRKILKFAIPAIGVWLCGPILSLIDTAAVGVLSGTVQQAALNPAVAVTDYAALLIVSLKCGFRIHDDIASSLAPTIIRVLILKNYFHAYIGLSLHRNYQYGCFGATVRSWNCRYDTDREDDDWRNANVNLCRSWIRCISLCLCSAAIEWHHWKRQYQPCGFCGSHEICPYSSIGNACSCYSR